MASVGASCGYTTIAGRAVGEYEEKKSRFIASLAHVESEAQALAFLEEIRAANRMARHNVYAYILRDAEGGADGGGIGMEGEPGNAVARAEGEPGSAAVQAEGGFRGVEPEGGSGSVELEGKSGSAGMQAEGGSVPVLEAAFRASAPVPRVRYSDDGEPQKTAGLPTLQVLQHAGLTDVVAVVTRYFGGTLLGTGGLVRAYTQATQQAVAAARLVVVSRCVDLVVRTSYANYEPILRIAADTNAKLQDTAYDDGVTLRLRMLDGTQEPFLKKLTELERGQQNVQVGAPFNAPFG